MDTHGQIPGQPPRRFPARGLFLLLPALWAALPAQAITRTVCASGCDHTTLQAALNAADGGDIVEMAAGEIFEEHILLPHKWSAETITVRSSRWAELPPPGYRVNPADHAHLMPQIRPSNTLPVLRAGEDLRRMTQNGVNLTNNTIQFDQSFTAGTWITCAAGTLPAPLAVGSPYVVRSSGTTVTLAQSDDGPILDLTDIGSTASSASSQRPFCSKWFNAHDFKFTGIDFSAKSGVTTNIFLQIGWDEAVTQASARNIEFDRVLVRGLPNETGPRFCMTLNGRNLSITDSWVGHCKAFSDESKAIAMFNTPGPVLIRNNYLSAASIGILTGGSSSGIPQQIASDITIAGNHIVKAGYMHYKSGAGAPTGACYYGQGTGAFYRNTTPSPNTCANGACYECQPDGTWAQNTSAAYRSTHYLTKGSVEFKDCERCLVEGNVMEAVFAGADAGNTPCLALFQGNQGGLYHYIGDTVVRNNWCKDTWSGLHAINDAFSGLMTPNRRLTFENNLVTGMARYPEMSMWTSASSAQVRPIMVSNGQRGVVYSHNTFRYAPGVSYKATHGITFTNGPAAWGQLEGFLLADTVVQAGSFSIYTDNSDYTCGAAGLVRYFPADSLPKRILNVALYAGPGGAPYTNCPPVQNLVQPSEATVNFAGSAGGRLAASSPFAATCTAGCSFPATDGADLGADLDLVDAAVSGVEAGTPSWASQSNIRVEAGSAQAIVTYSAPDAAACTLNLYTAPARIAANQHADTAGGAQDDRAGNTADGMERQFVLGRLSPLTPATQYHYALRCGTRVMPGRLRTRPATALGTLQFTITLTDETADNAIIEYGIDPLLAGSTATAEVPFALDGDVRRAEVRFPVASGQVIYARWIKRDSSDTVVATGPIKAYLVP